MKAYDLMNDINCRGVVPAVEAVDPVAAPGAPTRTSSPCRRPISTDPKWFGKFTGYAIAKFGMSLVTLGLSEELREDGIAANSLWPRTAIDTAAVRNVVGRRPGDPLPQAVDHGRRRLRDPHQAVPRGHGQFFIDDDVLEDAGVTDFSVYLNGGREEELALDFWSEPKGPHDPSLRL